MLGMFMMIPNLNFLAQGSAPSGGPSPGGPGGGPGGSVPQVAGLGGGGLPTDSGISSLSLSLALVPLGLMAVAVFPPFERFAQIFDWFIL